MWSTITTMIHVSRVIQFYKSFNNSIKIWKMDVEPYDDWSVVVYVIDFSKE